MNENSGYTKVACHLCGEVWLVPNQYVESINAENPYECGYCRSKLRLKKFPVEILEKTF